MRGLPPRIVLLIKSIKSYGDKITTGVHNPVQWLMEVTRDGSKDIE